MLCKYRVVLSIDGGGVRGIIPLRILDFLYEQLKEIDRDAHLPDWVDLVSSTSTSTIFTGALFLRDDSRKPKHEPAEILALYQQRGKQIFSRNIGVDAANSAYPLTFILDYFYGAFTLQDIPKHFQFVSYNQLTEQPYVFSNSLDTFQHVPLSKVMAACSAFPGVYPPIKIGKMELIDGMLATQNPAQLALDYARMLYPTDPVILISIGTGQNPPEYRDLFETESIATHEKLLAQTDKKFIYFRFQPELDHATHYAFENQQESIEDLLTITNQYLVDQSNVWQRLLALMEIRAKV